MPLALKQFSFSNGTDGPRLLITGGVHGDEFEPIAAIRRLIRLLETDPALRTQLQGQVTLIPIVNEAAFLRGHRCAEDGKDLARSCPGNPEGSITEQTAFALSECIRAADYYIDLHTGGTEFAVFPLAGYTLHSDPQILETQRQMARAFNLPVIWGTSPHLEGRSLSVARDASVPAIYCEYLGSATCNREGVMDYVAGCLNVMRELRLLEPIASRSQIKYVIEDDTPNSGYMQIQNPAPCDGYFEPHAKLGEPVQVGERIGLVYDMDNHAPHEIVADAPGLVLALRTFPRVRKGESVGVLARLPNSHP